MRLTAIIFTGLYHYLFGNYPIPFQTPFEIGHQALLLIGSNMAIFSFGMIYYKEKYTL